MAMATTLKATAAYTTVESAVAPCSPATPSSPATPVAPVAPVGPVKSGTVMVAFAVALEVEATKVYEPFRFVGMITVVEVKFPRASVFVLFANVYTVVPSESASVRATVSEALNPVPLTAMMLLSSGVTVMAVVACEIVYSVYAATVDVYAVMLKLP